MNEKNAKKTIDEMAAYWRNNSMTFSELKAMECASKSLEKQISKAIKYDRNGQNECPICESHVYTDDNYCFHCGQKIFTDLNKYSM